MEKQVLSIEQMQELQELGIDTSKASMCWVESEYSGDFVIPNNENIIKVISNNYFKNPEVIPTFTLQDMLEMLPDSVRFRKHKIGIYHLEIIPLDKRIGGVLIMYKSDTDHTTAIKIEGSYIDAAFNMLKWCKQNNYV